MLSFIYIQRESVEVKRVGLILRETLEIHELSKIKEHFWDWDATQGQDSNLT
jgi:hypothetical protein